MFNSLRNNSPIYIFHKGKNPFLETGMVQSVIGPKPKYQLPNNIQQPDYILDIQVKVQDQILSFQGLPAQMEITDSFSNGDPITISDSKSAINSEILNYRQKSQEVLDSIEDHKSIIQLCDSLIQELNPEMVEKQKQQEQIDGLKDQISILAQNIQILMDSNKKLVEQITKETTV